MLAASVAAAATVAGALLFARSRHSERLSPIPSFDGRWTLVRKLGEGGMGIVYEAVDDRGERVALKVTKCLASDSNALARFEREMELTADLSHPNIVKVVGRGAVGPITYYAMELVDGMTLDTLVRTSGPVAPGRALALLRQIASALAHVHGKGVIHCDVKLSNVMVSHDQAAGETVSVLDFGLARRSDEPAWGIKGGTPQFMSPEATRGLAQVGPASDTYAVGVLGYYLLTGALPFGDHTGDSLARAHRSEPPLPPSLRASAWVPRDLERVLLRCLAKDPSDRYRDGRDLYDSLAACADADWTRDDADRWWNDSRLATAQPERTAFASTLVEPVSDPTLDLTRRRHGTAFVATHPAVNLEIST